MLDKTTLIDKVIEAISNSLANAEEAATQAKNLATDEQSKAETQYDTVAIEAAFLAQGQSERTAELQLELEYWQRLKQQKANYNNLIPGALFCIESEQGERKTYFLAEVSGGQKVTIDGETTYVITPSSPLGAVCLEKELEDELLFQGQYWTVTLVR